MYRLRADNSCAFPRRARRGAIDSCPMPGVRAWHCSPVRAQPCVNESAHSAPDSSDAPKMRINNSATASISAVRGKWRTILASQCTVNCGSIYSRFTCCCSTTGKRIAQKKFMSNIDLCIPTFTEVLYLTEVYRGICVNICYHAFDVIRCE